MGFKEQGQLRKFWIYILMSFEQIILKIFFTVSGCELVNSEQTAI